MDYKYIEQLLSRYWDAETTLDEERLLRAFFSQEEIPAHLEPLRDMFVATDLADAKLSDDFDERLIALAGAEETPATAQTVKAMRPSLFRRLRPLYNAAAAIAIVFFVVGAVQHGFDSASEQGWGYTHESFGNSGTPEAEVKETLKTLKKVEDGLQTATATDTLPAGKLMEAK